MIIVSVVLGLLLVCFAIVLLFGAPYLPTLTSEVTTALELAELKAGDHLLELGCGDGRVVLAAAKRGLKVTGYELNPLLALVTWLRTRRYHKQVRVVWGNFWNRPWPEAQVIFVFLLPRYMARLDAKISAATKPVKLLSFAFEIPDRKPVRRKAGVYLYEYR